MMKEVRGYGSWETPITANRVASESTGLSGISVTDQGIFWLESRPSEDGKTVLVRLGSNGDKLDVTPPEFDVRSRVYEYGGAPYIVAGEKVYFTNFGDQRVYELPFGEEPEPITPKGYRYADFSLDEQRNNIWAVCEDHSNGSTLPENYIVSISPTRHERGDVVVSGEDFYSSPRLSPNGSKVAWISWNHPNMPWDGTRLHEGRLDENGRITDSRVLAGSNRESVVQPKWSPDGDLYFISDRTGWWNIYCWKDGKAVSVTGKEAEFTVPRWQFGISSYDFPSRSELVVSYTQEGRWYLGEVNREGGKINEYRINDTQISSVKAKGNEVWFIGGGPKTPRGIRKYDRAGGSAETFKLSTSLEVSDGFLSVPDKINFKSGDGDKVHGFYYEPRNENYRGPDSEKPPLIVISHGGPTSSTSDDLSPEIQFWTSRGFAVLDVNYRGSTGFGRDYRESLKGNWGVVDVKDCSSGALYLTEEGEVDGGKLIIRGGSAGGYTTLAALTFDDVFDAGASYYGVSDPGRLTEGTHKFESHYLDGLIGPYTENKGLYRKRSPIEHVDQLSCPVIFFQGLEDRVVLPSQAEKMYDTLRERGIATAYLAFEGEQHGFKKEESIKRALESELFFYSRIFGFNLSEKIEPVEIKNLS